MQIRNAHPNELETLLNLYQHLHATDAPLPEGAAVRVNSGVKVDQFTGVKVDHFRCVFDTEVSV